MDKLEILQALKRRQISVAQARQLLGQLPQAEATGPLALLTLSRYLRRVELQPEDAVRTLLLVTDLSAGVQGPLAGLQQRVVPAALRDYEAAASADAALLLLGAADAAECQDRLQIAWQWIQALRGQGIRVLAACHGRFHEVLSQGIAGIAQAVRAEHPDYALTVCHAESGDPQSAVAAAHRLCQSDTRRHAELTLVNQNAYQAALIENLQPAFASGTRLRGNGVYLITGGAGGVGLQIARHLRQTYGARVVLSGRRPLDDSLRLSLDAALGMYAYIRADVADEAQVLHLMAAIAERHGELHGVIHAAGVLDDGFFIRQDAARFSSVLAPKLLGAHWLDVHSRRFGLDFFALCSSLATHLPNAGQAAYAAANRAMAALSALRRTSAAPGRTVCLHWPLWEGGTMTVSPQEMRAQAEAFGIHPMPVATGIGTLEDIIGSGETDRWYLFGERPKLERLLAGVATPVESAAPASRTVAADPGEIVEFLIDALAEVTEIAPAKIHPDQTFDAYGLDSLIINRLNRKLATRFQDVAQTVFFEYPSIRALATHLSTRSPVQACAVVSTPPPQSAPGPAADTRQAQVADAIAVIGVAGRYPGAASIDALARRLREGADCIGEIPVARWPLVGFKAGNLDSASLTAGGYLDDVEMFDPYFFGISPRDAENIDPQERLFLQTVWHALENAGYSIDKLHARSRRADALGQPRHRAGVYVGMAAGQYSLLVARHHQPGGAVCAQSSSWSVANRVSYFLDLHGPSLSVDTACSSSLSALDLACTALRNDDIAIAIVGGVSLNLDPLRNRVLESAHMLSADRRCRSFGAGGSGFVPGEGVGAVVLRRLSEAERDGDNILGIIRSCRLNHGGRTNGYTVPSPVAQANLVAEALAAAGIAATEVGYVEAHGTGTQLGDPIELAGLTKAFGCPADASLAAACAIGSVKSNIGHLEPAAALAGLTKILLQFDSATIFPSLHSRALNPALDIGRTPFVVPQTAMDWPARRGRRVAALSSFGAGGSNGHLILEQRERVAAGCITAGAPTAAVPLFLFSAMTRARLEELAQTYIDWLQAPNTKDELVEPALLAALLRSTRSSLDCRLAICAPDYDALVAALSGFIAGTRPDTWRYHCVSENPAAVPPPLGAAQMADLIAQGAWQTLAEGWLGGQSVPWHEEPQPSLSRRMTLPLYPFERKRCWFHADAGEEASAAEAARPGEYPFAHRIAHSAAGKATVTFRLDAADPLLGGHRVNAKVVVAGTLQLELVRAAAVMLAHISAQAPLRFHDVLFASVLGIGESAEVAVTLTPDVDGRVAFEVATGSVHSRGQLSAAVAASSPLPLAVLRADAVQPMSGEALYGIFSRAGYAYGDLYRGIASALFGADQCDATLRRRDPDAEAGGRYAALLFHPGIVDAGLQAIAVLNTRADRQYLPFSCREIHQWRPVADIVRARAVRRPAGRDGEQRFDIHLLDQHERECVVYRDFCCRAPTAGSSTFPLSDTNLYRPTWERCAVAAAVPENGAPGLALVLAPPRESPLVDALVDALVERMGAANVHRLAVSPTGMPPVEAHLAALNGRHLQLFHCVGVADGARHDVAGPEILDRQALYTLFELGKTLSRLADVSVSLTLVTDDVFQLAGDNVCNLASSTLAGFAKSLSRELAGVKVALRDFSSADLADLTPEARREFLRRWLDAPLPLLPESAIAIRRDAAYFESFAPVAPAAAVPADRLKMRGTYLIVGGTGGLGSATAEFLAEQYSATVILVGRRPAPRGFIESPDAGAGRILHYRADITSEKDMRRLASDMRKDYGRIDGIFHSAIVLNDMPVRLMSRESLDDVLAPKTTGIVNLFTHLAPLCSDLIVLYSSAISQHGTEGQANYAAASTFEDTYARAMAQAYARHDGAPKVVLINWGFWREVGVVATRRYVNAFARKGVTGLSTAEGMALLRLAVNGDMAQVVTGSDDVLTAVADSAATTAVRGRFAASLVEFWNKLDVHNIDIGAGEGVRDEMQGCVGDLLLVTLQEAGLFADGRAIAPLARWIRQLGVVPEYEPLLRACVAILVEAGSLQRTEAGTGLSARPMAAREAVEARIDRLVEAHPDTGPILVLFRRCMHHLVAVMSGRMRYAEVMFPQGSDRLVAPLYRDNPASDLFNRTILRAVETYLSVKSFSRPGQPVRIVEIGAGTGGTTRWLLDTLSRQGPALEYLFTDISSSFVNAARERFGTGHANLSFALLDIEDAAAVQRLRGSFDILIATNVLHATRLIAPVLAHCRELLREGGVLMLNEACERKDIMTLTFGLSSGWWKFEDAAQRIAHSPLLRPEQWSRLLADRGFADMQFVGDSPHTDAFGHFACFAWAGPAQSGTAAQPAGPRLPSPAGLRPEGERDMAALPVDATIAGLIRQHLSELQKIPLQELGDHVSFDRYGVDSIVSLQLLDRLKVHCPGLSNEAVVQHNTIASLARAMATCNEDEGIAGPASTDMPPDAPPLDLYVASRPEAAPQRAVSAARAVVSVAAVPKRDPPHDRSADVAIIGISGRYPGAADTDAFWERLAEGHVAFGPAPLQRWPATEQLTAGMAVGGYLTDIDHFDSLFFHISPRDAQRMDPQERLLIETCWSALENAGYTPAGLSASAPAGVGVFAATMYGHYELAAADEWARNHPASASSAYYALANNVSRVMDFSGPSITVDSACSSALNALHLAVLHLQGGDCSAAIIAGVNLVLHPAHLASLEAMRMLSPRGQCRLFAADSDGFLVGEGVGAMLLKPLADAQADGDPIHAVIKGSAVNANGATAAAAPSSAAQAQVVRRALERAAITPDSIDYIELQSTGSRLGDKAEIDALNQVFGEPGRPRGRPLWVGSLKPNIGHLEAAAGMAQLTKTVLQLRRGMLAKTLADEDLRRDIDFAAADIRLVRATQAWPAAATTPRRAGVSSFGAGGSNVHVIVEEYQPDHGAASPAGLPVFPLSARKPAILRRYAERMASHFAAHPYLSAAKVAYTAQTGRVAQRCRVCIVFADLADLREQLAEFARTGEVRAGSAACGEVHDSPEAAGEAAPGGPPLSLSQLADGWVRGLPVDWKTHYPGGFPGRVVLPGYPFEGVSHWFERARPMQPTTLQATGETQAHDTMGAVQPMNSIANASLAETKRQALTLAEIETLVCEQIGDVLKIDRCEIHLDDPLSQYGFDSITLTELVLRFAEPYAIDIDVTVFFEYTSARQFAQFLFAEHADRIAARRPDPVIATEVTPGPPAAGAISEAVACLLTEEHVRRIAAQSQPRPAASVANAADASKISNVANASAPAAAPAEPVPSEATLTDIRALVVREVCSVLKVDASELRLEDPLDEYGFDSITLSELVTRFSEPYGIDIDVTIFFEHTSLASFAQFLFDAHAGRFAALPSAVAAAPAAVTAVQDEFTATAIADTAPPHYAAAALSSAAPAVQPRRVGDAAALTVEQVREFLVQQVSEILRIDPAEIRLDAPLREFGFDAVSSSELVRRIEEPYGVDLNIRAFISHPSLDSFAHHLFDLHSSALHAVPAMRHAGRAEEAKPGQRAQHGPSVQATVREKDVAVIGMAGQFPGSVDLESFWQNLCEGRTAITGFPQRRTETFTLYAARQAYPQFDHFFKAAFLDDFDKFDPLFFKISPVEARTIDPQQRLLLECAWHAIEDAGYNPRALAGSLTGVFVGVATSEYADILALLAKDDQARDFTGTLFSAHANRISFNLDLHGPSEAIDTACSSSLVATHRAVQALRTGECELALAGGVNIILGCAAFLMFGAAGMLAKDGRCKSFDDTADGYVRGEGVGFVLLKPLAAAIEDRDNIRAVIKGTAIRHGGRAASMTSPGVVSQANLIRQSLGDAELSSGDVGYIEAHGTGTRIGDPIEINALRRVFAESATPHCAVGTVKANIGHLETAAGIAGLIKTILVLERGVIPPLATLDTVNSMIKLEGSSLHLPSKKQIWQSHPALPRTAGISSFGIGGVIVHQVLQQGSCFMSSEPERRGAVHYPVMLSAQSKAQLKRYCAALLKRINSDESLQLGDVALTLARGRETFAHRVALLAASRAELISQLVGYVTDEPTANVFSGCVERAQAALPAGTRYTVDDLRAAAEAWAQGQSVAWDALLSDMPYRKVSLPGYPFERESVWVAGRVVLVTEEEATARRAAREAARSAAAPGAELALPQAPASAVENTAAPSAVTAAGASAVATAPDAMQVVLENLAKVLSETMHIPLEKLNPTSQFADFGVDSLSGLRIMQRLQLEYGDQLPAAAVLQNPTLLDLARFISESVMQPGTAYVGDVPAGTSAALPAPVPAPDPQPAVAPSAAVKARPSGVSLLEIRAGQGKHPLVLLCAASGDLTWGMHWIDSLADNQRVVGIELDGFGRADAALTSIDSLSVLARDCAELLRDLDCGDGFRLAAYAGMAALAALIAELPVVGNRLHEVILIDPHSVADPASLEPLVQMYAGAWSGTQIPPVEIRPLNARVHAGAGEQATAIAALLETQGHLPMPAAALNAWLRCAVSHWNRLSPLLAGAGKPAAYAGALTVIQPAQASSDYVAQSWPNAETIWRQVDLARHLLASRDAPQRLQPAAAAPGAAARPLSPGFVTLNSAGCRENIVCFPTLYGDPGYATSLSMHLGRDYSMFALEQWRGARPLTYSTIEALASGFAERLQRSEAQAPYTLLGLSFGGVVAYEVCRQLQQAGQAVDNLILIDPYMPNTDAFSVFGEMRLEVDGKDLNQIGLAGIIFDRWRVNRVLDFERLNNLPEHEQIDLMARHLAAYSSANLSFSAARRVIASHFAVDKANRRANTLYHPGVLSKDVNTLMIMASQGFYNPATYEGQRTGHHYETKEEQVVGLSSDPTKGFRPFLRGEFRLHEFACDHLSMPLHLRECAQLIAQFLGDVRGKGNLNRLDPLMRSAQGVVYEI